MATEIEPPEPDRPRNTHTLFRVSAWGVSAALALATVALTTQTDIGTERLQLALANQIAPARPVAMADRAPREAESVAETRRLEAQVRSLAADRDRLIARIASLEHNLNDMTGSIKRQIAQLPAVAPSPSPVPSTPQVVAAPSNSSRLAMPNLATPPLAMSPLAMSSLAMSSFAMPAGTGNAPSWSGEASAQSKVEPEPEPKSDTKSQAAPHSEPQAERAQIEEKPLAPATLHSVPMPPVRVATAAPVNEPAAETPRKSVLGVDLGGAQTMDILNARWTAVKANFGPLLGELHPLVAHDRRHGAIPYRLVVGPLPNGAAAAKLCARFAAARVTCRTVRFSGDRFAQQ